MRYKLKDKSRTLTRIDILLYCYYCYQIREDKDKKHIIRIVDLYNCLVRIDYYYADLNYFHLRKEIIELFPLLKNNHRNVKNIKINKMLIDYWGKKFRINYNIHHEIYNTFNKYEKR
ncbi:MAG: hypothetical protein C0596_07435 [Marinilabiliales bacterium]|nr:MAG: hypothetical protein C0596_07435 [Marinilabiliales bacterium]